MRAQSTSKKFWNREYGKTAKHLTLSSAPSEDLLHFTKWLEREYGGSILSRTSVVLDLGCGNGRNVVYLAQEHGVSGIGYDISAEGIAAAQQASGGLNLTYTTRSIAGTLDIPDSSVDLVLDMMASHFLSAAERTQLVSEIVRVLKPGGWLFCKTFLLDGDINARALLREHPADEVGSYIHPKIGVREHVSTEEEIRDMLSGHFTIHKILRSHKHIDKHGRANKRRSISVYAEKA